MSNNFFDWSTSPNRLVRFDTARAEDINAALDSASSGFDGVEIKTNAAIKLPDGETATAIGAVAARANKVLSFDASGNPVTSILGSDVANAQTNAANAQAAWNSFNDRYLGEKPSDPSLDNDGNALQTGALYWNSATNEMRAWSGTAWQVSYNPVASASQAEMETGTEAAIRSMSPLRVAQAIAALGKSKTLYSARSSNTSLGASDNGKFIDLSGNFTQTFDAAAILGNGWFCYLRANGPDEVLSANLLTAASANLIINGGFDADTDWTKGTGWTITGGVANGAATTGALTSTAFTAVSNGVYAVTYTLTVTSGTVRSRFGTSTAATARSTSGTYTEYWIGSGGFSFIGVSAFTGTIDNVSVTRLDWTMPALEVGADYVLDYTISAGGTEGFEFSVGATEMGASRQSIGYSKRFTAASASTSLTLLGYDDNSTSISNPAVYSALPVSGVSLKKIVSNGTITLDPSGSETIDEKTTVPMYPREVRLVVCDGIKLVTSVISGYYKEFYASGTWVKPTGYASHAGMLWGGGSSGYRNATVCGGAGGGCCPFSLPSSLIDATETVVIGAGGAAVTTSAVGNIGGGTSFAGVAIVPSSSPSTGSTIHTTVSDAAGNTGAIGFERVPPSTTVVKKALYAGGSAQNTGSANYSTSSIYGGGAGGSDTPQSYTEDVGGAAKATKSTFAGNGGFAQSSGTCGVGEAGFIPAGGGGYSPDGGVGRSGAGARGELRIWGVV